MPDSLIFDIKRYSINDGPGIRITIFLKGCALQCAWCHNPEGISPLPGKMYNVSKCIGAKDCIHNCPTNALSLTQNGIICDDNLCNMCGKCAEVCPTGAFEMIGKDYSVEEIMKMVEREMIFMDQSEGGVTISGGEPLQHPDFVIALLDACGESGIHRTVDTCGMGNTEVLMEFAKRCELFLFDVKIMDPEKHKKLTGASNEKILHNLKILAETGAEINIRIPFIKGVNEDADNIDKTAQMISSLAGKKKTVNLLPYHNIMSGKYKKLGKEYNLQGFTEPTAEDKERAIEIFNNYGVEAKIGG